MKNLFIFTTVLIALFSFCTSSYLVYFKYPLKNDLLKAILFLTQGALLTFVIFAACLTLVWPPA